MSITVDVIFDGEVLRPQEPLALTRDKHYSVTIEETADRAVGAEDAWSVLQSLAGTYDGPSDWSSQHDHYIYGSPKRGADGNA